MIDEELDTSTEETEEPETEVEETEEESVKEQETAEPDDDSEEHEEQSEEENSKYAAVRRAAEAQAKAKYEKQMNALNERFKTAFAKYGVNNAEEYLDKYESQQKETVEAQLKKAGLDSQQVQAALLNTPEIRELRESARALRAAQQNQQDAADLEQIKKLDPSVTSWKDVVDRDKDRKFYDLVFEKGMNKTDAYKIAFFDDIVASKNTASKQAAVNQSRGKSHLKPVKGNANTASTITDDEMDEWKAFGFSKDEVKKYKAKFN